MLLSLIIPVYDVEEYIERCLLSCIKQKLSMGDDYEIIVVNDGTPDNSMSIVEQYQKQYPYLIYSISQLNQGLSSARNLGLSLAKGEYVWFIDSDDYIENNCLSFIATILKQIPSLDMLQLQYRLVYDDTSLNREMKKCLIERVTSGQEVIHRKNGLPNPAQFTIYRRSFLIENKLFFVEGILHEDVEFKPRATYLAKRIISCDKVCYNYYQRKIGSITSQFKIKNAESLLFVLKSLYDFSACMPLKEQRSFNNFIGLNINTLLFGLSHLSKGEQQEILQKLSKQHYLFYRMFHSSRIKYVIEGLFFLCNTQLGFLFYNCLKKCIV